MLNFFTKGLYYGQENTAGKTERTTDIWCHRYCTLKITICNVMFIKRLSLFFFLINLTVSRHRNLWYQPLRPIVGMAYAGLSWHAR